MSNKAVGLEKGGRVGQYADKNFIELSPQDTLESAAKKLSEASCEFALVKEDGELKGILTAADVVNAFNSSVVSKISNKSIPEEERSLIVSELIKNPRVVGFMEACGFTGSNLAISISAEASLEEAAQLLSKSGLSHVLVLDGEGEVVGVLRSADVLKGVSKIS